MTTVEAPQRPTPASSSLPLTRDAVAIVGIFAAAGLLCGWLWEALWSPPIGVAYHHDWYPVDPGVEKLFDGTAIFVLIALVAGLVLGALCTWLFRRSELVTVGSIVLGGFVAGLLMHWLGGLLGPSDPSTIAAHAKDFTHLPGRLRTYGDGYLAVWPLAALVTPMVAYLCFPARRAEHRSP